MAAMKHITLSVPDQKYSFFMELIRALGFVKEIEDDDKPTKEEVLAGIKESLEEVKLHQRGKIKLKTAQEFLDEL